MATMKALVFQELENADSLEWIDFERPQAGLGEVVVRVKASALNHRDVWILQGLYAGIKVPIILGSDGSGIVEEVGSGISEDWIGEEVIINPALDWGIDPRAQQSAFRILGLPDHGTQAEYVKVPAVNLVKKPAYLSFEEAAAIPLGGLTGYRALFSQGGLKAGETVLLTGIGGGVAALMFKMARAAGANVLVTSGGDAKIEKAIAAGAMGGANYRQEGWAKTIKKAAGKEGISLIVDSAGGEGFLDLPGIVNPGGRIVFFGATAGNPSGIDLRRIFWKQITIQGTTMGTPRDFADMVRLFETHRIQPIIDGPFPMSDHRTAYQRMIDGKQFGKIVLTI